MKLIGAIGICMYAFVESFTHACMFYDDLADLAQTSEKSRDIMLVNLVVTFFENGKAQTFKKPQNIT